MDTIGGRIKAARIKKGMTQAELAKLLGVAYQNIGQWENGKRVPKVETLMKIGESLGVPWIWFTHPDDPISTIEQAEAEYREHLKESEVLKVFSSVLEGAFGKSTLHTVTGKHCVMTYKVYENFGDPFALVEDDISVIARAVYAVMSSLVDNLRVSEEDARAELIRDQYELELSLSQQTEEH